MNKVDDLLRPFLEKAGQNETISTRDVIKKLRNELAFLRDDPDRDRYYKSGNSVINNRIWWARELLIKAGLLEAVGRGLVKITEEGKQLLATSSGIITRKKLAGFKSTVKGVSTVPAEIDDGTPESALESSYEQFKDALASKLLGEITRRDWFDFEYLAIKLLEAMGYGVGDKPKGWKDEGIDGIIRNSLGFGNVLMQAKKFAIENKVGSAEVQQFLGAIGEQTKGVFITTSEFTENAKNVAKKKDNIVLINGKKLAELMIEYNVGCTEKAVYKLQEIDEDFFNNLEDQAVNSAS